MSQIKPFSRLLTTSKGSLQPLLEWAHYLQALTRLLRQTLDPGLAAHITLANLRDDIAVVTADSPVWLAKIRYLGPVILRTLNQQPGLDKLQKIQFKVLPPADHLPPAMEPRRATLSSTSSDVLKSAASGIDDPDLADALRRLSRQVNHSHDV